MSLRNHKNVMKFVRYISKQRSMPCIEPGSIDSHAKSDRMAFKIRFLWPAMSNRSANTSVI